LLLASVESTKLYTMGPIKILNHYYGKNVSNERDKKGISNCEFQSSPGTIIDTISNRNGADDQSKINYA
jgi:hypothetical protein